MPVPSSIILLNSTTPAAPAGKQNAKPQEDGAFPIDKVSLYLPDFVGDSGSGGLSGAVPAPAAGDAAAGKFLTAGGGFAVPVGGGAGSPPFTNMLAPTIITPPVLASLTWGNQGASGAASYNAGGALYMSKQGSGSTELTTLYKAAPATPWTFTVGFYPGMNPNATTALAGIAMRLNSSGKLVIFQLGQSSVGPSSVIRVGNWTSYTVFSTNAFNNIAFVLGPIFWIRVINSGTLFTFQISADGQNFKTVTTQTIAAFIGTTPDQVGINIEAVDAACLSDALFVHWAGI